MDLPERWLKFPFSTDETETVTPDMETVEAVRRVIVDWDGRNWAAIRDVLERDIAQGHPSWTREEVQQELASLDVFTIRMRFSIRQKTFILSIGGRPETAVHAVWGGERMADEKTDDKKNRPRQSVPRNPDVVKLAKKIKRELPVIPSKKDIALDFTDGDDRKAESLLRKLREYPHLLD